MERINIDPSDIIPPPSPPKEVDTNKEAFAIIGFVFSLLGLFALLSPNCLLLTILAIVFSAIGIKSQKRPLAIAGIIIAVIIFIIDIIMAFVFVRSINT
jgi:uncharacterized membrane protein YccC